MSSCRTCLVTGANAGIGRAAVQQLVEAGHRVLLGCRDRARGTLRRNNCSRSQAPMSR
jgi:retinol dehydrogenase-14